MGRIGRGPGGFGDGVVSCWSFCHHLVLLLLLGMNYCLMILCHLVYSLSCYILFVICLLFVVLLVCVELILFFCFSYVLVV